MSFVNTQSGGSSSSIDDALLDRARAGTWMRTVFRDRLGPFPSTSPHAVSEERARAELTNGRWVVALLGGVRGVCTFRLRVGYESLICVNGTSVIGKRPHVTHARPMASATAASQL